MVAKPARPSAARELRRLLHDSDGTGVLGDMAHAIYVKGCSLFAAFEQYLRLPYRVPPAVQAGDDLTYRRM